MTEYNVGDRVLVPGVVTAGLMDGVNVRLPDGTVVHQCVDDLRPDTGGRDLTANDVADAVREWTAEDTHYAQIAEELTRIARGDAGSAGDDTAPPAVLGDEWIARVHDARATVGRFLDDNPLAWDVGQEVRTALVVLSSDAHTRYALTYPHPDGPVRPIDPEHQ